MLFLFTRREKFRQVYRVDLAREKNSLKQLVPGDPAGVATIGPILVTPDGKTFVTASDRTLADLYLWKGSTEASIPPETPPAIMPVEESPAAPGYSATTPEL